MLGYLVWTAPRGVLGAMNVWIMLQSGGGEDRGLIHRIEDVATGAPRET